MSINILSNSLISRGILVSLAILFSFSCSQNTAEDPQKNATVGLKKHKEEHVEIILLDFEKDDSINEIVINTGSKEAVYRNDSKAIKINMDASKHHISRFDIKPTSPWNLTEKPHVAIAFDMENPGDSSISFYVFTYDADGLSQLRSFVAPRESHNTYYIDINVPELTLETGLRSNPDSWKSDYEALIWRARSKVLNAAAITHISFDVRGALSDKTVIVDNVRAVYPQGFIDDYLVGLVDEFGQNAKMDFAGKVDSIEALLEASQQEQAALNKSPLAGRSKFSGWLDGPKLEATGYFRTQKHDGKWSLVDPEGYLFFSNGLANVRMANTSTMTGYDFAPSTIKQRDPNDLTPEDSIGLNTAPENAWPTRFVSSSTRAQMFTWLPEYNEAMGLHFGYRREVHGGAVEQGETYSFYRANLARKYQTNDTDKLMQHWKDTTLDRMLSWGFTSFGNWIDTQFYQEERFPYFANGWIIGDFKTVSSGNDHWAPLPDPFDPLFTERTYATVQQIAEEVANSPWCVGVFIDNEKSWGMMGSPAVQYGVVLNTLNRDATDSPTKAEFSKNLRAKYLDIAALNAAWETNFDSWKVVDAGINIKSINAVMQNDFAIMLELYATEYFRIVDKVLDELMPNHLYMGVRFADWAMTPEVRRAAAKHVDVMSYNYYREGISDVFWSFLAELDKPSIIGEFHNGSLDSGLLNPGLIHADSQFDRGLKYAEFVNSVIDHPQFVGTHWFQYIDSPLTGRAYDGENYNVGFVSVADIPYAPLVEAAKEVNKHIYTRRYAK